MNQFSAVSSKREDVNSKPNIILVMADDMGYECLSCYGSISYSTPELDKLAEDGIRFTNCYAQPLCTPSRVKIMTGKYNYRNYESFGYLNPDQKTFGNLMKENGYSTCIAGKWQLSGDASAVRNFGFDEHCLWNMHMYKSGTLDANQPESWLQRYKAPTLYKNGRWMEYDKDNYGPDVFCDFILDFISGNKENPFFVYYPMVLVHDPFVPTPDSQNWNDESEAKKNQPKYFEDMVSYTDKIIGRIRAHLYELGLDKNTIFIFTGDNGTDTQIISQTIEGKIRGGKGKMTDAGTRVPFLVSWPLEGIQGIVNHELIGFADFYATFSDLANTNDFEDGKSFLPILTGDKYKPRQMLEMHYDPKWGKNSKNRGRFCRDKRYKLYYNDRFYDLLKDKNETNPLTPENFSKEEKLAYQKLLIEQRRHPSPSWH